MRKIKKTISMLFVVVLILAIYNPIQSHAESYEWMKYATTIPINEETITYDFTAQCYSNNYWIFDSVHFYMPAKQSVCIKVFVAGINNVDWYFFDENGQRIGESERSLWNYNKFTDTNVCTYWKNLDKGSYYISFYEWYPKETTEYIHFKISTYIPTSTRITSIKSSKRTVTLQWNKAPGAEGYIVYRSTSKNGKYKTVATVKGNKSKYKLKNVAYNKTYFYRVKAYRTINGKRVYSEKSILRKYRLKK